MEQLTNFLNRVRASLWLLPAAMSAMAVILAWFLLFSDLELTDFNEAERWWLFSGDAITARNLLSSLLSGMITMTSLVVSITMVVLSLAAGQLGPRLIGNFMRDWQIQAVFGLFMATIVYTLFVLRSVNDQLGADYVPHIAVSVASALAMLCLFALLFFVHKLARSIIADTVVKEVAGELESAIAGSSNDAGQDGQEHPAVIRYSHRTWVSLGASGYVQVIDYQRLVTLAAQEDMLIGCDVRAGQFLLRGGNHVELFSHEPPSDGRATEIRRAFVIGLDRTPTQDIEFSIRQLVEIAVRAMSTGVNDPFTAVAVVNRLGSALESASRRPPQPACYRDAEGSIRVVANNHDFGGLVDASFNQIRQAAAGDPAVLIQMSRIIGQLALVVDGAARREALLAHLDKLERTARGNFGDPADVEDFATVAEVARKRLASSDPTETLNREAGG
ncbi:MAG TPA: DUF2254 domain-containing protein [Afifellaceae bacterium]|nr:DUF2254 domain-containing protein [Afifellaceae bacterium]